MKNDKIPNDGYYVGTENWKASDVYKNDPQYWIIGIEDGWIYPTRKLMKWYVKYKESINAK